MHQTRTSATVSRRITFPSVTPMITEVFGELLFGVDGELLFGVGGELLFGVDGELLFGVGSELLFGVDGELFGVGGELLFGVDGELFFGVGGELLFGVGGGLLFVGGDEFLVPVISTIDVGGDVGSAGGAFTVVVTVSSGSDVLGAAPVGAPQSGSICSEYRYFASTSGHSLLMHGKSKYIQWPIG